MFNDVLNFLKFQSKDIEHYKQYQIGLILLIVTLLEIPYTFLSEGYNSSLAPDLVINLLITIPSVLIEAIFFVYWLGRKDKKYSFATVLNFTAMLTISTSIVIVAWAAIEQNLDPSSWASIIIALIVVIYCIYLLTANMSMATGVTKKYAFGGLLLIVGLLQIPNQLLLL